MSRRLRRFNSRISGRSS